MSNRIAAKPTKNEQLERLWTELLKQSPNADQFLNVARVVPYLQERAWQKYVETNPSESKLRYMLWNDSACQYKHMEERIGALLIKNYPTKDLIFRLMQKIPELQIDAARALAELDPCDHEVWRYALSRDIGISLKERIAKKLLTRESVAHFILCAIIDSVPAFMEKAGERLLKRNPQGLEAIVILRHIPSLAERAWEALEREGNIHALDSVVVEIPAYRMKAAQLLLKKQIQIQSDKAFSTLFCVLKYVPELREDVWERLKAVDLSNAWLEAVAREAPELADRANALLKTPERTTDTIMGEIFRINTCGSL